MLRQAPGRFYGSGRGCRGGPARSVPFAQAPGSVMSAGDPSRSGLAVVENFAAIGGAGSGGRRIIKKNRVDDRAVLLHPLGTHGRHPASGASAPRTTITEITITGATAAGQDESQLSLLDPLGERGHRGNWVLAAEPTHPDDHGVTVDQVGLGGHRAAVDRQRDPRTRRVGLSVSQDVLLLSGEISAHPAPDQSRPTPS